MAEDAFERFRRLRNVVLPVSEQVQGQQTEETASLSPLALMQRPKSAYPLTALALFSTLRQSGVVLIPWVDHVRIAAPPGTPCPALLRALLDLVECYEERVAIAQHCAGLSQAKAEALAWDSLIDHEAFEVL